TNWQIEGIADFNGDNRPDLVWRDYSSGANAVWFMGGTNNATLIGSTSLTPVATNWQARPYTRYEEPIPIDLAGNTTSTAFSVGTLSGSGVFSDRIDSTDPYDYYQFKLFGSSTVKLLLDGLSANASIQLLNSSGTIIQGSYNSGNSAESISTTLSAGTYYVLVYQASGNTTYSLNLSATASSSNLYYFTYYYGNGDSYQGYGYTTDSSYYSGKYINDASANETGNKGYYYISNLYSGYSVSYNNRVYVSSYYNSETSTTYTPYSGFGSSGLGSEYGYLTNGDSSTYYGGKYYEADLGYQYYSFKYSYGSGQDYYTGYGYTDYGKYTSSQYLYDASANETGNYGFYQITGITNYASGTASLNKVYVSSYYNSENSTSYTPYSGSGSSGLGSEYGYLTSAQTSSNDYFGVKYYEADTPSINLYYFTYYYGANSDYYQGYGYTTDSSYYSGKYINDASANETGNKGYYYISNLYSGYSVSYNNRVYVSSYYNSETSTTYTPYSGFGSSGLGSEYGYLTNGDSSTYYGGKYYEADLGYQYYSFKYSYGSGQDYYTGYGYTDYGKYTSSQYLYDASANETGNYGFYQITGITNYASGTASLNKVYVSSYYNSENSTSYTPYSSSGSSGLGSEYGYLTSAQTSSNDYFGVKYYEADVLSRTTDPLVGYSAASGNSYIDALLNTRYAYWNTSQNGGSITYSFYRSTAGAYGGTETVSEVSDAIKANVRQILATLESFIKVSFVEVEDTASSCGVLRYMFSNGPDYAYAYYPASGIGGDVHLSSSYESDSNNRFSGGYGTHGYMSLIHETCHALGLKHPGNYNGSGTGTGPFLAGGDDNTTNSLMSYNFAGNSAITLMPYDIQALQYLYGSKSYNSAATTYSFNSVYGYTTGTQAFGSTATQLKQTIWDSGGLDTFDFSMLSTSQSYRFDLREGGILTTQTAYNSYTYTDRGAGGSYTTTAFGTRIALGTVVENLVNSRSNDYIIANSANNLFTGYTIGTYVGNDIFELTSSSDVVDLSSYSLANLSVSVNNSDLTIGLGSYGSLLMKNYYGSDGSMKVLIGSTYYTYSNYSGWQVSTASA
ncbi:MAG: M10 family metallopeptidase C-terminal domain-containing protein, partial [Stenomitos rutilans HA7619-LM2]|nr:M10 family metallopeptidase C-terminal domain-containing protein [Stenomitos rutilans HA7619-LM2]